MNSFPLEIVDHLGRKITLLQPPQRIISLCPSQTSTLYALGIGERVVGRTRFCIHPKPEVDMAIQVGGTKEVKMDRIRMLKPDLIIGEKEENTKEMIAELEKKFPVFVTDVRDHNSARKMILDLGILTSSESEAKSIVAQVDASMAQIEELKPKQTCLYFIWKDPWMVAGADTFIDSMLEKCGFVNLGKSLSGRYPMLEKKDLLPENPSVVLLSSEPYPFKSTHLAEIRSIFPNSVIKIVDGEAFSWYGSNMVGVEKYLNVLLQEIKKSLVL